MDERACIELAAALGVTNYNGWQGLMTHVRGLASIPSGVGRVYDDIKAALGSRGGGGCMAWPDLVAEVQAVRVQAESVKDVTRDLADAMGMVRTAPNDWPVLLDHVRRWRRDRETSPTRGGLGEISKALGHSYDTNIATILDSITRLKEENLRLENERGTALAEERVAHDKSMSEREALRQAFDGFRHLIHRTLEPLGRPVGMDAVSLHLAVSTAVDEIHKLRDLKYGTADDDDVCGDCGAAVCERCELCHDCSNGECETGRAAEAEPVISALESLTAAIVTDVRDWEANRLDAWIYGVIVGWPPTALDEVASLHAWPDSIKRRLTDLHAAVLAASGYAP